MISCRVNGPNRRPNIRRDTDREKQKQGFNVVFEIWLINSTKNNKMGLRKLQYYIPTQIWDSKDGF
jgi:hypothetical protein